MQRISDVCGGGMLDPHRPQLGHGIGTQEPAEDLGRSGVEVQLLVVKRFVGLLLDQHERLVEGRFGVRKLELGAQARLEVDGRGATGHRDEERRVRVEAGRVELGAVRR